MVVPIVMIHLLKLDARHFQTAKFGSISPPTTTVQLAIYTNPAENCYRVNKKSTTTSVGKSANAKQK